MTKLKKLSVILLSIVCAVSLCVGLAACGGGNNAETYTVTVTDTTSDKKPVADVWLEFYYVATKTATAGEGADAEGVGQTYTVQETLATAKTNNSGVAEFISTTKTPTGAAPLAANEFNPVEGATYYVKLAQNGATAEDRALPYNYALHTTLDTETGLSISYSEFDASKKATVLLDYVPNHFYHSERPLHPYYREFVYNGQASLDNPEAAFKESEDKTLQLSVKAGKPNYFDFSAFKNPKTLGTTDINPDTGLPYSSEEASAISVAIVNMATLAATGKYRLTISTTTASATPVLRQFFASAGYTPMNDDGIPTSILAITGNGSGELYTGTDYIELDLDATAAAAGYYFYVTSTIDCTATITVERIGDASERGDNDTIDVTAENIGPDTPKFLKEKGLTLVPVDGSVTAVYNPEDGYYHMNTANGKVIGVMFTKSDLISERAGDAISSWKSYLYTDEAENKVYNYSNMVSSYANLVANEDGVCGLTQDLYNFLHAFGDSFMEALNTNAEYRWLLPCVYYAQDNPAITVGTPTAAHCDGFVPVYFTFISEVDGWYAFENVSDEISFITLDGDIFADYKYEPFFAEAGKKYSVCFEFGEEALDGTDYYATLVESEESGGGTLTVGEDQEVTLKGPNETEAEFVGVSGAYTITINPGMQLLGQTITLSKGFGPGSAVTLNYDEAKRVYTAEITIYQGDVLSFACEGNLAEATILVTIAAAQA